MPFSCCSYCKQIWITAWAQLLKCKWTSKAEHRSSHHLRTLQSAFYSFLLHISLSALTGPNSSSARLMTPCHVHSPVGKTRRRMAKVAFFYYHINMMMSNTSKENSSLMYITHSEAALDIEQKKSHQKCTAQQKNTVGTAIMPTSSTGKKKKQAWTSHVLRKKDDILCSCWLQSSFLVFKALYVMSVILCNFLSSQFSR